MPLSTAVIAYESEEAARRRLMAFGYAPDVAREIAVYLAQATDLPEFVDEIAAALGGGGVEARFTPLDELSLQLRDLAPRRDETIVWALTDGVRFYRGSSVPALARLEGFPRFGSPSTAAHLAQDKFACLALASAAGLAVPPTRLMDGENEIAALGRWPSAPGPLFVKPNTLGAKIGIFADSLCRDLAEAKERARRIEERYRDRALIQPFLEGDDVRVSFMELGGDFADQLGVERIVKNPASETGGAYLTMKDNETLSGAKDTAGNSRRLRPRTQGCFRSTHGRSARGEGQTLAARTGRDHRIVCVAGSPCGSARLLLDRFSHRRGGPAGLIRIRGLPGRHHLRFPELPRPPRRDARRGAGESDAARFRETTRDGGGVARSQGDWRIGRKLTGRRSASERAIGP